VRKLTDFKSYLFALFFCASACISLVSEPANGTTYALFGASVVIHTRGLFSTSDS